jgi:hypothetical protein
MPASYLLFDAAPPAEALGKKLREFNGGVAGDPEYSQYALSEEELVPGGETGAKGCRWGGGGRGGRG